MTTPNPRDCTVRCEVAVRDGWEPRAEAAFADHGWTFERRVALYLVDVPVSGSRTGASTRARQELLAGLRRHGVRFRLGSVVRLDAPDQEGDRLQVHEVRTARWPRLERLMVAAGRRDTGDSIQAASQEEADRKLVLVVNGLDRRVPLGWRRRFGQPELPPTYLPPAPEPVALIVGLAVGAFLTGLALGLLGPAPGTILAGAVLLPALAFGLAKAQRRPEWALASLAAAGTGILMGAATERAYWYAWPFAMFAVWVGAGLKRLVRDLSMAEKLSWLLPLALPLVAPVTAQIGDLGYGRYLGGLGLPHGAVELDLWQRVWAAAVPMGVAAGVALSLLGALGWLRFRHLELPASVGFLVAALYLVFGVQLTADQGADAAGAGRGYWAIKPGWACVQPVETPVPTRGAALPFGTVLRYLELKNGQLAFWPAGGVVRVPADKVVVSVVAGPGASCPTSLPTRARSARP